MRAITDQELLGEVTELRSHWKAARTKGDVAFEVDGRKLTPEELWDAWINGAYFLDDPRKRPVFEALTRDPL